MMDAMKPSGVHLAFLATLLITGPQLSAQVATDADVPQFMSESGGSSESPISYVIGVADDFTYTVPSGDYVRFVVGSGNDYHELTVQNGATLNLNGADSFGIGNWSSHNSVTVTGSGTSVINGVDIEIADGPGEDNRLTINSGASVSAGRVFVGSGADESNNHLTVTGSGSSLTTSGIISVGYSGPSNSMTVSDGASVNAYQLWLSSGTGGGNSSVRITGPGTTVTTTNGGLVSDNSGSNNSTFTVSDGASFEGSLALYSFDNTAVLDGLGSTITASSLRLGHYSDITTGNTLSLTNGSLYLHDGTGSVTIKSGNYLQIDQGFFAWNGDHVDEVTALIEGSALRVSDGSGGWTTATTDDLIYQYFDSDGAAASFSGYDNLGGYTIVGTLSAVPEPSTYAAGAGLAALLLAASRRRRTQAAVQ